MTDGNVVASPKGTLKLDGVSYPRSEGATMLGARDIDEAVLQSRFGLSLPDGLEREYDRRSAQAARRQIVVTLVASLILSALGLIVDFQAGILSEAVIAKLGIQAPFLVLGIFLARHPRLAPRRLWLTGGLPMLATVAVVTVLAAETAPPFTDRYITIAGLTVFAANLVLPLTFRNAVFLTAANVSAFVALPLAFQPFSRVAPYLDVLFFMSAVALATTALVYVRERAQKRTVRLMLANERQTLELQALVTELTQLAHRDPLTGAGNRRSFDMRFAAAWRTAALRKEELALILVDVDHFKLFNDAAGHAGGDECLRAVAAAIAEGANCPIESVMRYGGEEFALIVQSADGRTAEGIRRRVEALALRHPGLPPGRIVTVSVGKAVARAGMRGSRPEDLMNAADSALYDAKRSGRNRVVIGGSGDAVAA